MSLLEISGVSFSYGQKPVLNDVSLGLDRGGVMCLLGPNGCGKSTLLGCVLGLLRPVSGEVSVNGRPVLEYSSRQLACMMSYVPQSHMKTFPYKVSDIVMMGRTFKYGMFSSPGESERQLALLALERAGLKGFEERRYTELSGGEIQLVLVARALCQDAPLMLLDEPTAHLDFKHELDVLGALIKLVKETGLTILMASHSINHAFYFESEGADTKVALMDKGCIRHVGKPGEVCSRDNLHDIYGIESRLKVHNEGGKDRYYVISWK